MSKRGMSPQYNLKDLLWYWRIYGYKAGIHHYTSFFDLADVLNEDRLKLLRAVNNADDKNDPLIQRIAAAMKLDLKNPVDTYHNLYRWVTQGGDE